VSVYTTKSKCIVCGDEFEAQRYGTKFCTKPNCRKKFNRQEKALERAGQTIGEMLQTLIKSLADPHFTDLSKKLLLEVDTVVTYQLDQVMPDRKPKPKAVFDARRPAEIKPGGAYWALPPEGGDLLAVIVKDTQQSWYEVEILNDKNQWSYNKPKFLLPGNTIFIEITERGQGGPAAPRDNYGRPAVASAPAPAWEDDDDDLEDEYEDDEYEDDDE